MGVVCLAFGCQTASTPPAQVVERREQSVDAAGGNVALSGGTGSIAIPAGALGAATQIAIAELAESSVADPPGDAVAASPPIALTPHGQQFLVPVAVTIAYAGPSAGLSLLRLDDESDTTWETVAGVSFADGLATFETMHFSVVEVVRGMDTDAGTTIGMDGSVATGDSGPVENDAFVPPDFDGAAATDAGIGPTADSGTIGVDTGPPCTPDVEVCNALDDDCDTRVDEAVCGSEICNGVDDDGNGTIDDGVPGEGDPCGLTLGICMEGVQACNAGTMECTGGVQPTAEDCGNGLDDDCNGVADDCGVDSGPPCIPTSEVCNARDDDCDGLVDDEGACGGTEICNGVDDDGNGTVDDGVPGEGMSCGTNVGTCRVGQTMCVGGSIQCTGAIGPASETCPNGADDDCNGLVDDCIGVDAGGPTCDIDGDGYVADTGCGGGALDCDDTRSDVSPAQVELCDSIDNDCDALVDEGACG